MVSANDAKLVIISKYANNMIKKIFISNESGQPKDIGIKDEVALGKAKDALKAAKLALDKAHAAIGKAFDVDAKLSNTTTEAYRMANEALTKANEALTKANDRTGKLLFDGEKYMLTGWFPCKGVSIDVNTGVETANEKYDSTPFLLIDKSQPIIANLATLSGAAAVALYDANMAFIGAVGKGHNTIGATVSGYNYTIAIQDIPDDAVYFRCSSSILRLKDAYYTNGSIASYGAFLARAVVELQQKIDEAKRALFVDQWNAACDKYGKYDPVNAPDPQRPFYLNTLWLTYREAINSLEAFSPWGTSPMNSYCTDIRTNIPPHTSAVSTSREYQNSFERIEVVNLDRINVYRLRVCLNGSNLKKVLNFNAEYLELLNNSFNAPKLIDLQISNLKISLDLSRCPLINLTSWQGLVSKAANTSEITVTVHPDVYAKMSDESNAEWHKVMTDAEAKQITFATTN